MKKAIAILLLLVTAFYVLPCSKAVFKKGVSTAKYMDTAAEDGGEKGKETGKEFISSNNGLPLQAISLHKHVISLPFKPVMMCAAIHTPPPDLA